ncbi:hypothetical protein [Silvimonas soli]|uniref:hypothetical protein n=1 Tax=Silvimonas soli TaxID=2980100 RepID=UPI0024B35288|nr:hypothetical protein [Silvimonas soli]
MLFVASRHRENTPVAKGSAAPQVGSANKADIRAILGASGSGKTTYVMQQLRQDKPDRLLIWDTKGEFSQEGYATAVRSISELVAAVRKSEKWKLALIPYGTPAERRKLFDMFAALAFAAGRCTVVAEVISGVAVGGKINAPGWQGGAHVWPDCLRLVATARTHGQGNIGQCVRHPLRAAGMEGRCQNHG